jgi:hypothetical protein
LDGRSGRALCFFATEDDSWLAFARLHEESLLYRWTGNRFARERAMSGPGGREFEWFENAGARYLVQVNFLHGSREAPQTALQSIVYEYVNRTFAIVDRFSTFGGTDATAFKVDNQQYLAVSNSLTADVRFRVDSNIYRVSAPMSEQSPE